MFYKSAQLGKLATPQSQLRSLPSILVILFAHFPSVVDISFCSLDSPIYRLAIQRRTSNSDKFLAERCFLTFLVIQLFSLQV